MNGNIKDHPNFIAKGESSDYGDSVTNAFFFNKGEMTEDDVKALFDYPDGTGPCQCSHCMADRDCCGSWTAGKVSVDMDSKKFIIATQGWGQNV